MRVTLRAVTMLPSLPQSPMALPPSAPIQPTICLLMEPAKTISTTSTVAWSVTRKPALELGPDAELLEHLADLRPAAVHDDGLDAGLLEQNHVLGEIFRRGAIAHGMSAILDDHDLLVVTLHVRQSLHEHFGLDVDVRQLVNRGRLIGHGWLRLRR